MKLGDPSAKVLIPASVRFASDPDRVGAEKLSMTAVPKAYLEAEYVELPAVIGSA